MRHGRIELDFEPPPVVKWPPSVGDWGTTRGLLRTANTSAALTVDITGCASNSDTGGCSAAAGGTSRVA